MASYENLKNAGITEGKPLSFEIRTLTPSGVTQSLQTEIVERFTGGGFFGSVIILPESVIKTTSPDALHELLRQMNWPVPFPSRTSETAAQLDFLSGKILNLMVPCLTNERIITPDTQGYTHLHQQLGFAQIIERMHGRGPTFRDGGKENRSIKEARQQIWDLRHELGSEHTAQVHPNNPFGKPNLWISENGQIIWLDYLPAFRHTGRVLPFFHFPFHYDVQQAFDYKTPTYNQIHTNLVRNTLTRYQHSFPTTQVQTLYELLELYDENWQKHNMWANENPQELFITDALNRGIISSAMAERLRASDFTYNVHRVNQLIRLGVHVFLDKIKESPLKIFWSRDFQHKVVKFTLNSEYRRTQVLEHTTLWGLKQAYEQGLISKLEYTNALSFIPEHELRMYVGLQTWYFLNSRLIDAVTVPLAAAAATSSHPVEAIGAVSAFNLFAPGIIRAISTVIVSKMNKIDLKRATLLSAIPVFGNYAAIPLQLKHAYGEEAGNIEHYTMRALIAAISELKPQGGWGSDLEEKMWNALIRHEDNS